MAKCPQTPGEYLNRLQKRSYFSQFVSGQPTGGTSTNGYIISDQVPINRYWHIYAISFVAIPKTASGMKIILYDAFPDVPGSLGPSIGEKQTALDCFFQSSSVVNGLPVDSSLIRIGGTDSIENPNELTSLAIGEQQGFWSVRRNLYLGQQHRLIATNAGVFPSTAWVTTGANMTMKIAFVELTMNEVPPIQF